MPAVGIMIVGAALLVAPQQAPDPPRTVAESSGYTATSRAADVADFCKATTTLPHGDRVSVRTAGTTHAGREQLLVHVSMPARPGDARVRVLAIGNIHAGEVEGKEALLVLLREFANGQHADILQHVDLWFLPIYNVDGNEAVGPDNRAGQNGPAEVGERQNAQGLDLNRDFVKVDAPETRTLLGLFRQIDPHVFVDLHTTNGSYHGYHLTYAPSLSPNIDEGIRRLSRRLLDRTQATMRDEHHFATFDYGNFETRDWDGSGAPESNAGVRGWYTYDHRARYGINYFGQRNRIGILSEAYSYADFRTRIAATRAFVLCLLHALAERHAEVDRVCRAADRRLTEPVGPVWFPFDTTFGAAEPMDVLVGAVDRVDGVDNAPPRFARKGEGTPERLPVVRSFQARQHMVLPLAWAIPAPSAAVLDRLQLHGVSTTVLDAARRVHAARFAVTKKAKPKRPYQGHQELVLGGQWLSAETMELPAGAVWVTASQPLARVAACLLEPQSEDSLSTWNFFEADTGDHFPVVRVLAND